MLSSSLVSGCVMGGTDPEGYLQDMQLRLIKYANERKEPFKLEVACKDGWNKVIWVKPDILMLSSPVQSKDRWLMRWSCGLLGVRNHASNMETVSELEGRHSDYKQRQLSKLDDLVQRNQTEAAVELALNIKADQELMDEILEMAQNPKDVEKGMYGDNYGNPYAFNARVALLAQRMGMTPINNCKTGKDRTEDSEATQKLLASEIDEKVEQKKGEIVKSLSQEATLSAIEANIGIDQNISTQNDGLVIKDLVYGMDLSRKNFTLVPKRDFLSAENLKKEINALNITTNVDNEIQAVIDGYSPGKPGQENLYDKIRNLFGNGQMIPKPLD